ncbi:MAG: lipoate--protein ligase [Christensenellaceae bacterium]|nr:lipoate--protein ligase [Christensenellaceae bacterium]
MLYISDSTDVDYNLALEETLLASCEGRAGVMLFYRNAPAVVVGAYQNTHQETDAALLERRGIRLARRISGGGAVYHDLGNVCFAFIFPGQKIERLEIGAHLKPLVRALKQLGIPVQISPRNDILLNGFKISGTASRIHKDRLLLHGTLLYDADLKGLAGALGPERWLKHAKGVASVRSSVCNIRPQHDFGDAQAFMRRLIAALDDKEPAVLPQEIIEKAHALAQSKYAAWSWKFGRNPRCSIALPVSFPDGTRDLVWLALEHETIQSVSATRLQYLTGEPFKYDMIGSLLHAQGAQVLQ